LKEILIFDGGPGSGKSTHAKNIAKETGYVLLEASSILDEWLGSNHKYIFLDDQIWSVQEQKNLKNSGNLCDWHFVCAIMQEEINDARSHGKGIIISGFPRTEEQSRVFGQYILDEQLIDLVAIISLDLDKEIRRQRVLNIRKIQENRIDDTPETFNHREEIYQKERRCLTGNFVLNQTAKITIVPYGTIQETTQEILQALKDL